MAVSSLQHTFSKADHNTPLRCVAIHQAYQTKSQSVEVLMDVQYAPTVTLEGAPTDDIEEGVDDVVLRCLVDSNPGANVMWRINGQTDVFSFQREVRFSPVTRKHSGTYTCEARNPVGGSEPISVNIDVKYRPRVLQVGPAPLVTATLHNHTLLECIAEANPPPHYTWIQMIPDTQETMVRGYNATLLLEDVLYEHQGEYVCVASSVIRDQTLEDRSQPIIVEVVGAPQVLRYTVERNLQVEKGQDAVIQVVFCSDPRPSSTSWEWGSLRLEAGNGRGRYVAENLAQQDVREDCYFARLRVQGVDVADSRDYILNVQNEKGADRYAVGLRVNEPVSMSTVIGIVIACLVILVLVTLIVLYAFKTEKWCFSQRGDFKPTDLDSDKSDLESQKGTNGRHQYLGSESRGGRVGGGTSRARHPSIPPDALYTSRPRHTTPSMSSKPDHEYENLKIMPTQTATPSSCQMKNSSSRPNSSCNQQKRDELTTATVTGEVEREMEEHEEQVGTRANKKKGNTTGFMQSDMLTFKRQDIPQDEARDTPKIFKKSPQYVPVYRQNQERGSSTSQDRVKTGPGSNPRRPSPGVIYAELQLPRASNNGSMRRGGQRRPKTQYAEITFQGHPLQSAEI
ncbi:Kin of IRRE-like protein 2 [Chionoecetes opilio]|uniref:Kin of IRRE-like protein 2 n=1 Tax=Chionoecetes opilio TaxID=41210 RepID=A0A8J5CN24_CHIOP|nr:Kin of IRRE-like protein 2 [Chionoecetes opilio]